MEVWSQYFIELEPALSNFLSFFKSNFVCGLNMVAFAVFPEWLKLFPFGVSGAWCLFHSCAPPSFQAYNIQERKSYLFKA